MMLGIRKQFLEHFRVPFRHCTDGTLKFHSNILFPTISFTQTGGSKLGEARDLTLGESIWNQRTMAGIFAPVHSISWYKWYFVMTTPHFMTQMQPDLPWFQFKFHSKHNSRIDLKFHSKKSGALFQHWKSNSLTQQHEHWLQKRPSKISQASLWDCARSCGTIPIRKRGRYLQSSVFHHFLGFPIDYVFSYGIYLTQGWMVFVLLCFLSVQWLPGRWRVGP